MANSSIFELPEYKPYSDRFTVRSARFNKLRRYYDGSIFDDSQFKLAHKLYAQTKSLFAFLARAVDLDVALVPGVMQPWELPADQTPQQITEAQTLLYDWSDWSINGDDWLEDGCTLGESFIKIVPNPDAGIVQMQRLKPEITLHTKQHIDPITQAKTELLLIVDRNARDATGKQYEYAEAITPDEIRTYWNGEPHGYDDNDDRYPNPLLFVPVIAASNDTDCRPTFHKTLPQLVAINEMASYLADIIGRHAEPQWAAFGVDRSDMEKSGNNLWFFPSPDSKLQAILAELDIPGTMQFIDSIKAETKSNLPELAFDDLRAKDNIATETLQVQLVELDAKIWRMRRRYDSALIRAHQMAALAAGIYRIGGLAPLLTPHAMDYARPVRPVSRLDEIRLEEAELMLEVQHSLASGERMTQAVTPAEVVA